MSEVKWIKLVTEFFDDEKIKLIEAMPEADMVLVIWIKLLTLAGKKNMNGYIFLTKNIPYTDEMFSTLFNRPLNTVRLALNTFKNFGMINYEDDNVIKITNWEKHQNIEGMEKIREQNRLRVAKFRKLHKEELEVKKLPLQSPLKELDKKRIDKIRLERNITVTLHDKLLKTLKEKDKYNDAVFLTKNEYNKLIDKLGNKRTEQLIEELSLYIISQGKQKKYKSHYATILSWHRRKTETETLKKLSEPNLPPLLK